MSEGNRKRKKNSVREHARFHQRQQRYCIVIVKGRGKLLYEVKLSEQSWKSTIEAITEALATFTISDEAQGQTQIGNEI